LVDHEDHGTEKAMWPIQTSFILAASSKKHESNSDLLTVHFTSPQLQVLQKQTTAKFPFQNAEKKSENWFA
jgi:hypothetical protein